MTKLRYSVDLQYFAGEKTEKATPHKREEGRKKGQVFKSADLCTAVSMLAIFLYFRFAGGGVIEQLAKMMGQFFNVNLDMSVTEQNVHKMFSDLSIQVLKLLLPTLIIALVVGAASQIFQVGFLFLPDSLMFKSERISLLKGLKRTYSLRAIVELLKSMLKIIFVGMITFVILWMNRQSIAQSASQPLTESVRTLSQIMLNMGIAVSIALIALSLLDYLYQKYDYEKNMRMSKQDIKDEFKTIEGNPQIKSKIKERQKQMALNRMMQEVPNADVIITNPTHFAVALQYDAKEMNAPKVIAKGADLIALRIKEIAKENQIVIVEKKPLARALYHHLEIGDSIPEEFFKAVAEILAYVYRLKGKA
ncbi:flagellar biosynthesis protein FlhB [Sporolactobacillus shoreicorticis]|uniref:Flagellar biosynthetic protein FlhB n=1 Tax=Sporolactobacillus shoreicorticis TaxID=1923877 RepID=A0ABW5S9D7_9BACL|nr:flagellar biosynthesis protein FlhB [Sporolactobacillus shoreicorticis]MCO7125981.1 flagellar biosynthesis protein FlhB [Sporolactobacillus shoreicorticis]